MARRIWTRKAYHDYIKSPDWKAKSRRCKKLAEWKCKLCGAEHVPLVAHHNTYRNLGDEPQSDLTCLCRRCHMKFHNEIPWGTHNNGRRHTKGFQNPHRLRQLSFWDESPPPRPRRRIPVRQANGIDRHARNISRIEEDIRSAELLPPDEGRRIALKPIWQRWRAISDCIANRYNARRYIDPRTGQGAWLEDGKRMMAIQDLGERLYKANMPIILNPLIKTWADLSVKIGVARSLPFGNERDERMIVAFEEWQSFMNDDLRAISWYGDETHVMTEDAPAAILDMEAIWTALDQEMLSFRFNPENP